MAKWVHADILDGGLLAIKTTAVKMVLLKAYAAGDSYATVASNIVASVDINPNDLVISSSGSNRVLTTAAKSVAASAPGDVGDAHIAFTNGTNKVLWVTDETGEAPVVIGDTCNFPSLTYTSNQPT